LLVHALVAGPSSLVVGRLTGAWFAAMAHL